MQPESQSERVLALARQKGLLRPTDLPDVDVARVVLTRLLKTGHLEKVDRGLYRLPATQASEFETLNTVAAKVPRAVFCLLTALRFHGLTTQSPRQIWIAMPRGSHVPDIEYPPLKMVQVLVATFDQGIETHERDQVKLRVYSVARTLADCFKFRNKIGIDVAIEALKDARAQQKVSADELWHYSKVCRVTNVIRPYLEALE